MSRPCPARLLVGSFADRDYEGNGVAGGCTAEWDRERSSWKAELSPLKDEPPIVAWADNQRAAILAVFAKWLGCEAELRDALPPSAEEQADTRTLVELLSKENA